MIIEADFMREYRIDTGQALREGMSWRRFQVLLLGLSGESRLAALCAQMTEDKPTRPGSRPATRQEAQEADGKVLRGDDALRFFVNSMGAPASVLADVKKEATNPQGETAHV